MAPRSRAQNLTADLLHDLEVESAADVPDASADAPVGRTTPDAATKPSPLKPLGAKPAATKPSATKPATTKPAATKPATTKRPVSGSADRPGETDSDPSPLVQAALYAAPRSWRRPALQRSGTSVSLSAGPLRLRLGRDPRG